MTACPSDISMNTAWGTVKMELGLQGKLLTRLVIAQAGEYTDATRSSRSLQVSGFLMLITSDTYTQKELCMRVNNGFNRPIGSLSLPSITRQSQFCGS